MQALIGARVKIKWGDEFMSDDWMKHLGHEWRRRADSIVVQAPLRYCGKILEFMMRKKKRQACEFADGWWR
eukprot:13582746-Heterocapsa_arctica.AAC.1